jgi:hypothetical protein
MMDGHGSFVDDLFDDFDDLLMNIGNDINVNSQVMRHAEPMSEREIEDERRKHIPKSSISQCKWAQNVFNDWIKERNQSILSSGSSKLMYLSETSNDGHEKLELISKEKLSNSLRFFFHEVRKRSGDLYPANSLRLLFFGIQRFLHLERGVDWRMMTESAFLDCRNALDAAMKNATKLGISLRKKVAASISIETENSLWERNLLGSDCPKKLNRTLIYLISKNCGLRGGQELRGLKWGEGAQLTLKKLPDGTEVLQYNEDLSKTNRGGLHAHHIEPKSVTVYATEKEERCLIKLYKKFTELRPLKDTSGAFFLQAHPKYTPTAWYLNVPLGHNTLSNTIRNLMDAAGEDTANYSNQSGRRTAVTRLLSASCPKDITKKITGHRSDCVLAYNEVSEKSLKMASKILTNSSSEMITFKVKESTEQNNKETIEIVPPSTKKMKVDIDGSTNKISITFE